jgi:glycosyltransferase involved in cell wall biosynthesis
VAEAVASARPGAAGEPLRLDVCICTHDPRPEILGLTIRSIARQAGAVAFHVLVVDNASSPPVPEDALAPLRAAGIPARISREERLGNAQARLHAIRETAGDWILFVDDDNELADGFVAEGLRFIASRPTVAAFGGKLLLPDTLRPPAWARPFLRYLAIKDVGDEVILGSADRWGEWEPPTAGAFVRRDVAEAYRARAEQDPRILRLGRRGRNGLASCEDSLMMRQAFRLGAQSAYNPRLSLLHHLDESRFRFGYVVRLMSGYGSSHVLLDSLVRAGTEPPAEVPRYYRGLRFLRMMLREFRRERRKSFAFGVGMAAYHWGARKEYLRQRRGG